MPVPAQRPDRGVHPVGVVLVAGQVVQLSARADPDPVPDEARAEPLVELLGAKYRWLCRVRTPPKFAAGEGLDSR